MTKPTHIQYAEAEKAYSEHLKQGQCKEKLLGAPYRCPLRIVRNIAYVHYTKNTHPSLLKGGTR